VDGEPASGLALDVHSDADLLVRGGQGESGERLAKSGDQFRLNQLLQFLFRRKPQAVAPQDRKPARLNPHRPWARCDTRSAGRYV